MQNNNIQDDKKQDKQKKEPRYKKVIRKTKGFLKENWKILLIITLFISSVELLYMDSYSNQETSKIIQFGGDNALGAIVSPDMKGKSRFRGIKIPNVGKKLMNTNLLTKVLYGLWVVIKNLLTLLLFVFIFMAIPLIPILVFMLIMFFILRTRIGNLKQL